MGETPSNYNIQNQRYDDDPLENVKTKASRLHQEKPPMMKKPKIAYGPPNENDIKLAEAYGGPPRGAPIPQPKISKRKKEKSKSANKRELTEDDRLFKVANKVSGFVSDFEEPQPKNRHRIVSDADREEDKIKQEAQLLENKPRTARSNVRNRPKDAMGVKKDQSRAKSRKATRRDSTKKNTDLEKIYGGNIEDMFLYSDMDEEVSDNASFAPSNASRASNIGKTDLSKLKGLESIYLQRLESSTKHKKKQQLKKKKMAAGKMKGPESIQGEGNDSERDEISSMISENYAQMQKKFYKGKSPGS